MKKTALLFLAIALLLSGCASPASEPPAAEEPAPTATPEPPDERKTDEEFVAAVSRALQARWDVSAGYSPADLAAMSAAEYQSYLRACVDAEEKELGSIVDYRFLDADLASLAQQYYHALSLQRGGAEYARTSALAEYNATWVLGYNYRVAALWDLTRDFSLKVEKDYSSHLEELLAAHHEAKKQVAFREMTDRLPGELVYEPDPAASDETRTCHHRIRHQKSVDRDQLPGQRRQYPGADHRLDLRSARRAESAERDLRPGRGLRGHGVFDIRLPVNPEQINSGGAFREDPVLPKGAAVFCFTAVFRGSGREEHRSAPRPRPIRYRNVRPSSRRPCSASG